MNRQIPSIDDYHDFISWLEDHNYCKVIPCERCHFWHSAEDPEYSTPEATCRRHKIKTYHDDYCSDAVQLKGGK